MLGLTACVAPQPGSPALSVLGLYPVFQRAVVDYVNRCDPATPTEVRVSTVEGETVSVNGAPPQTGTFTVQVVQNVGKRFTIDVTSGGTTTNHHVRCLPTDFPNWSAQKTGTPQAAFYATTLIEGFFGDPPYSAVFDTNGVPVWWLDRQPQILFTPLANKNFAIVKAAGMEEYDLAGSLVRSLNTVGGPVDNHEVLLLPNGNYVMATAQDQPCVLSSWGLGLEPRTCINHVIQELNPATNPPVVVWQWDTALHIPVSETPPAWQEREMEEPFRPGVFDPWHFNSVEDTGDGFIISFRHLDAVFKIDKLTGSIVWKLGGTDRPESLDLVGDPLNGLRGQHDARLLPDGSVSIYDNGTSGDLRREPRSIRYAVNTSNGTATLVADLRDPAIGASFCCGSTRVLPGGNHVTGWGSTDTITETTANGTRVFRLSTSFVYRGVPILPGEFTAEEFRAGMDAQYPG